jgi:adenine-specific DNA methylase
MQHFVNRIEVTIFLSDHAITHRVAVRSAIPDFAGMGLRFPSTRYQGSKQKLVGWIWDSIKDLPFDSVLDAFSGTASVSYHAKLHGKSVVSNDILRFNHQIALSLIQNDSVTLSDEDILQVLTKDPSVEYPTFVQDTFRDIYYTDEENAFLDMAITNISRLDDYMKRALAYSALGQACLVKRPFNLFHRKNLYIRLAEVERSFGNKATWDGDFAEYFRRFAQEFNHAVFANGRENKALNADAFDLAESTDLVYIDTPYVSEAGVGVDYSQFYHFLEGMVDYDNWRSRIDVRSKHRRLVVERSPWTDREEIVGAFDRLIRKFDDRTIVISYRSPGIPTEKCISEIVGQYCDVVKVVRKEYKYVLSKREERKNGELLIIGHS